MTEFSSSLRQNVKNVGKKIKEFFVESGAFHCNTNVFQLWFYQLFQSHMSSLVHFAVAQTYFSSGFIVCFSLVCQVLRFSLLLNVFQFCFYHLFQSHLLSLISITATQTCFTFGFIICQSFIFLLIAVVVYCSFHLSINLKLLLCSYELF